MRVGLIHRTVIASGVLAVIVGATFALLLSMIAQMRDVEARAQHSEEVLVAANRLERLVVDLETGERGFLITGEEDFLQPWQAAQAALPQQARTLEGLVTDNAEQQGRARRIAQAITSYVEDYSVPLVDAARSDPHSATSVPEIAEGKARVDAIRADFDDFLATEESLAEARQQRSDVANRRAIIVAAAGLAGSIVLIAAFAGYLSRAIVRPVRRAAAMADRLAGGELGARMSERGVGEIGVLERSFNTMASSLEESRDELSASRARLVTASDQVRRRIERDLHDGTQQRLVSLALDLRSAEAALPPDAGELRAQLARIADDLIEALDELREVTRGIHPAILSAGGLVPALKALARRSALPVVLDGEIQTRLPEHVEAAAYYVVAEAITNAAKHARASTAHVEVSSRNGGVHISVRDDGVGGADPGNGTGLIGLTDRVQALGGTISVRSPLGEGTVLLVDLPGRDAVSGGLPAGR